MKYNKTGIIRCENDETSPEITVSTFRKCCGREVKMIKLRETEGAGSSHTNSLFQQETVLVSGLVARGRHPGQVDERSPLPLWQRLKKAGWSYSLSTSPGS